MAADPQSREFDAVVVGAGAIGLACAWRAAQRGIGVAVLERDVAGRGASAVAAGMLAPVGEATWGEEPSLELALASHRAWPSFAAELADAAGRDCGYLAIGALHVALDRDEAEELRRRHRFHQRLGLDSVWLRPSQCRRLEGGLTPSCAGGLHARGEAAADPRALTAALREALARAGGELIERAEVVELISAAGAVAGVRTADGRRFATPTLVLAAGPWSGAAPWLPDAARPPVRPVKGEILTLRGPAGEPVCERIVVSERVYLVPRADGRLIVGATVEERGFDTAVTAGGVHELLREAYRALPDVAELELAEMQAGLRPGTPDNAPLIGRGAIEGLVLATGHYRNGILLTPATADAVAELLAGGEPPAAIAPFAPDRFAARGSTEGAPA